MKMEIDDLDDLLKKNLADNRIPFEESYWNRAQQMVQKKRNGKRTWLWFLLPVVLLFSSSLMWNTMNKSALVTKQSNDLEKTGSKIAFTEIQHSNLQEEKLSNLDQHSIENSTSTRKDVNAKHLNQQKENLNHSEEILSKPIQKNLNEINDLKKTNFKEANPSDIIPAPSIDPTIEEKNIEASNLQYIPNKFLTKLPIHLSYPKAERNEVNANQTKKKFYIVSSIELGLQLNRELRPAYHISYLKHVIGSSSLSFYGGLGLFQTSPELGTRTYSESIYGFGETKKSISIDTRTLHYLQVPIGMNYKFKGRYDLHIGMKYLYLLSSTDVFHYYENELLINKENKDSYTTLFQQHDLLMDIHFGYWMNSRSKLSLGYFNGLQSITKSKLFQFNDLNKNRGFKLSYQYILN